MVLVDTSIWVNHFQKGNPALKTLLIENDVLIHPLILGELACSIPKKGRGELNLFQHLPQVEISSDEETLHFIHEHRLYSKGMGWVEAQLLASALLSKVKIWTKDPKLLNFTSKLRIHFNP